MNGNGGSAIAISIAGESLRSGGGVSGPGDPSIALCHPPAPAPAATPLEAETRGLPPMDDRGVVGGRPDGAAPAP
jgi:hypothetical protein